MPKNYSRSRGTAKRRMLDKFLPRDNYKYVLDILKEKYTSKPPIARNRSVYSQQSTEGGN